MKPQLDEIQAALEKLDARLEAIEKKLSENDCDKPAPPVKKKPKVAKKRPARRDPPPLKTDPKRGKSYPLYFTSDSLSQELFFGQVIITLLDVTDERILGTGLQNDEMITTQRTVYQAATFEITLPGDTTETRNPYLKVYRLEKVEVGTRRQFEYKQETYFFDLLEIGDGSLVKARISKRRYGESPRWWK